MSLRCRHAVILQSMEKFSVASLQALVIIAFDIIGSGRGPSAWSVVGSMTRTVEQLRLSVEDGDAGAGKDAREFLIRRMSFLRESNSWIESEERRRVFWNVFLMDRFCSVATGWNNSLTSADVRRRLPCEGAIWQAGNPVRTPYFGIAERSSPSQHVLTPTSERHPADEEEVESIGGFAFCIEATESLNLVTAFFLQHAIDFIDPQGIQMWLMRFKELDLRLVKWRLFLPPKWRNASVLNQDGIMDPNLTLAHITHNTAVIQLHQCVAYPSPQWRACPVSLPSANSAETCITAACEVSTIAQQFLHLSPGITSPQFSFCLFIAGRVLLAHSAYNGTGLHPAFDPVTSSLTEIARRWTGRRDPSSTGNELPVSSAPYQYTESPEEQDENLASKFSKRLEHARRRVGSERNNSQDPTLDIHQPVYSDQMDQCRTGSTMPRDAVSSPIQRQQDIDGATVALDGMDHSETGYSPDSISLAFPPLPVSFERFPEHAEAIGSLGSQSRVHFEDGDLHHGAQNVSSQQSHPMLNVNLDDMFGDQYHQLLRVSTFADAHQTYANYISSDGQGL
ncbi:hypothetical protein W97_05241 [Coniosporium apollinis CBS 100218]|uniref:Xylanolytic transcriptional activator regulatory domain-containing protein n=1 Tax=Coniosporium apollinis (strain CBS 100218) TaxID=1168221 RepID=R7YVX6_CONA1|nr:uncharacterized protein W97_05241 [Coniosporium apollinis CBS 100218]EON65998.1 hypothetical protein W97_05241 [Coniosporium apollinis CBS 100218]